MIEKANKTYEMTFNNEEDESKSYLDIWDLNPSYKDINLKFPIAKILFSIIISFFLSTSTYLLTFNISLSIGFSIFLILFFLLAFSDNFLSFRNYLLNGFQNYITINPFQNIAFWKLEEDPATILILNKKDSVSIAIRIFKVDTLPENVHPTLNQFLKALNKSKISYTYQVVQTPILDFPPSSAKDAFQIDLARNQKINSLESFQTSIYFSVYHSINGVLSKYKLRNLIETVQDLSREFKSNFSANYHHTKVILLTENDLINAIRTYFFRSATKFEPVEENHFVSKNNLIKVLFKTCSISLLVLYLSLILICYKIPIYMILLINFSFEIIACLLWWRDILYFFSKKRLSHNTNITTINPFVGVQFFQVKRMRDVIFAYIDKQLLLGLKIFNLIAAAQPSLTYLDKFVRGIENHKINFNYNLQVFPVLANPFPRECSKAFNQKTDESLEGILFHPLDKEDVKFVKHPRLAFEKWLDMRSGIWNTMLTLSTSSYLFTNNLDFRDFIELHQKLSVNSKILKSTFEDNFLNYKLVELKAGVLISGFLSESIKNHHFRLNGSHLNYVYFQGKNLMELAKIANEFKKGIDTRIAAEFNTPLQLRNFISIGHTINTEFLEEEIPLGLTLDQFRNLFITNGTPLNREHTKMKIASELIKSDIPCVIFDYTGKWSKLIKFFEGTAYQDHLLHFKLGSSFRIDIKNSGIKYDQKNVEYLNLFYDVFTLAFKEQKRNLDVLKETISKNDELDLTSLMLGVETTPKWDKPFYSNSLLLLLKDFTDQSQIFSKTALEDEEDINPLDFLKYKETIILDLSILKDLEKKTFVAFVILSKFIHLIETSQDYYKKIIIIPHVDLFFDSHYIDTSFGTVNYGKIDKFIEPLLQNGFGLIFSANQIRYLHPHVFNYFNNIIIFKANDIRDIAALKSRMNLQELHGTGYYSSRRNNTYQIDYLMNMQNNEVIVKRSDINQAFPGRIDFKTLLQTKCLKHEQVIDFMEKKGYKLRFSEKRLLRQAKKTIFEKDFGIYSAFIDDIIHFLKTISSIDRVGNLYIRKLKEELLKYIYPKASSMVQDNAKIKEIRDKLLKILIKQGYLIESHPRRAGGSEAVRPSYSVGSQYQKALQDYYETRGNDRADIKVDIIEKNIPDDSRLLKPFQNRTSNDLIDVGKYKEFLHTEFIEVYYKLFKMYCVIQQNDYRSTLEIGKNIVSDFLKNLYNSYLRNNNDYVPELDDIDTFLDYLVRNELLPFSEEDLLNFLRKAKEYDSEDNVNNLYDMLTKFYLKLDNFQLK